MKKMPVMLIIGAAVLILSSCGQPENNTPEILIENVNNLPQSSGDADETDLGGFEEAQPLYHDVTMQNDKDTEPSKISQPETTGKENNSGTDDSEALGIDDSEALEIDGCKALGMKEYEYPAEFIMGDNLKTAIAQLALSYASFSGDTPYTGGWNEYFIAAFIQNSRVSFDYLDSISDQNNGQISIEELNYMQYSLTNTQLDFSSVVSGSINRYDSASFFCSGLISEYDYTDTDSGVIVTADLEVKYDGAEDVQNYKITVELIKNPYSCFDGYSIADLSSTIADKS